MKLTPTLFLYLARVFFMNTLLFIMGLAAIIYLFDTLELLRRASKYADVSLGTVLYMGAFKLPEVTQLLMPFAVFYSAILTYWQLTRRSELAVARASGFSVWQFSLPIIGVAIIIGSVQIMAINPLGALALKRFEVMERQYLERQSSQIAFFKDGLWLRQSHEEGYVIIHAPDITQPDWVMKNPTVLFFNDDDRLTERLDSKSGHLKPGYWTFEELINNQEPDKGNAYVLPTTLTQQDLEDSFLSPESLSFWTLPSHIRTLENAGFNALKLKVYFQSLLSQPLFYAALILLAATVSMRPPRLRGGAGLIMIGTMGGFILFFFINFLQALGISGQIPIILAAWAPVFITAMIGGSILLILEDG